MAIRRGITFGLIVMACGALVGSVLLTRMLFNVDRYRPAIMAYIDQNTGKKTDIERLALTFLPTVTIHVYGLNVQSPPPFPPSDLVTVGQADAVIDPWSLLHGAVVIKSLVLKDVTIDLLSAPDGRWNFQNPQASSSRNTFPLGIIDRVVIENAQLRLSDLLPSGAVGPAFVEAHDIASELTLVDLAAIINPSSPSLNGQGRWQASRLRFGAVEATQVGSTVQLDSWKVSIADVKAQAYGGTVTGAFSLNLANTTPSVAANARISAIDLARVLAAFRQERASVTGNLEGDLTLAGEIARSGSPLAGLHGTGHARITNGLVPSLMSNARLRKLASFNDLGPAGQSPAAFSSISADLQLANRWVSSQAIAIDGHGVNVDGSGRVSVSGSDELSCRGVATITTKQGFWIDTFAEFGGARFKDGQMSFPFRIEGTIENPTFSRATGR